MEGTEEMAAAMEEIEATETEVIIMEMTKTTTEMIDRNRTDPVLGL